MSLPLNQTINRSGLQLQNACESSWFIWNSELYYIYSDRDLAGLDGKTMKIMKPTLDGSGNITNQTLIATFGTDYGCMDCIVVGGTLHVFATSAHMDFTHKGNSIVHFTSTDLTTWSSPTTIYTVEASGQIYNVGVSSNGSGYTLAYEVHNPSWYGQYYVMRFLTSSNLTSWTDVGVSNIFGGRSCPSLAYVNNRLYIWTGLSPGFYQSWTTSLPSFTQSRLYTLLPKLEYEDIYVSDPSIIEFGSKVYILYCTSDQATYMRITYATYDGSMSDFVTAYQAP